MAVKEGEFARSYSWHARPGFLIVSGVGWPYVESKRRESSLLSHGCGGRVGTRNLALPDLLCYISVLKTPLYYLSAGFGAMKVNEKASCSAQYIDTIFFFFCDS
jgi:hypothetical protein